MLARVAIDPDSAVELKEGAQPPGRLLIRYLRERSLLVAESDKAAAALVREFAGCGSTELAAAIAMLVAHRREQVPVPTPLPLSDVSSRADLESWRGVTELIVLAEYRLGDVRRDAGVDSQPEIASLREALNARVFDRVADSWQRHVPRGTDRERVWTECFLPLAEHTGRVYILDGFAATNLIRTLSAPGRSGRAKSGCEWFLSKLARSKVREVHLASSERALRSDARTPDEVCALIRRWFNGLETGTAFQLHLGPGNFDHGRRIAFDGWAGFDLHKGLASFDSPQISEDMGMNASPGLAEDIVREVKSITPCSVAVDRR